MIQCERKGIILVQVEHPVCPPLVAFSSCHPVAAIVNETEGRQVGGQNNAVFSLEIVEQKVEERDGGASTEYTYSSCIPGRRRSNTTQRQKMVHI
jgi:hypothetical protein